MNKLTNWANIITFIRILLGPVLVVVFYLPIHGAHVIAAFLFLIAGLSDWLDGYVARAYGLTSKLGAFLDPVADKVVVAIALVLLIAQPNSFILVIPAMIIIVREIVVSGLREWMAEVGSRASVAVSYVGKCKTAAQMIAITVLLFCGQQDYGFLLAAGYLLLYLSAVLTIWSMVMYLIAAWPEFERP